MTFCWTNVMLSSLDCKNKRLKLGKLLLLFFLTTSPVCITITFLLMTMSIWKHVSKAYLENITTVNKIPTFQLDLNFFQRCLHFTVLIISFFPYGFLSPFPNTVLNTYFKKCFWLKLVIIIIIDSSLWSRGIKCGICKRKLCKKCFGRFRTESKNSRVCEPCVKNKVTTLTYIHY